MVRHLDHVQVVLDDYHGVALVHEFIQDGDKALYVVRVQSRSGLVEDIHRLARAALGKLRGEFHPLRLAARKSGGGLTQLYISQAHLLKGAYLVIYLRHVLEEFACLVNRHFQHVVNALALVLDFQRFAVVTPAAAHLAGDVHVGEEVHFYLYNAVAAAVFASAARNVEGKSARRVTARLCVRKFGKKFPYGGENARVSGGVGARSPAYRALVDGDHLIQIFYTRDVLALHIHRARAVEFSGEGGLKYLADERALAAAGNARYRHEFAERDLHVDIFQIILSRALNGDELAVALPAFGGYGDHLPAAQIVARYRFGACRHLLRSARHDHLSAMHARAGTYVHDVVGFLHSFFIVLHHYKGVAQVAQTGERVEQSAVVALMKSYARLVENVEHPGKSAAYLRGEANALTFSAGESGGRTGECEIVQAHVHHKAQPAFYLLYHLGGDHIFTLGKL